MVDRMRHPKKVSRVAALRAGIRALGFTRDLGSTCERRERYLPSEGTASGALGIRPGSALYLGPAGSLRVGRSLRTSYAIQSPSRIRLILDAAREAGYEVRAPRPARPAAPRVEVNWIARAGVEVPTGADSAMLREVSRQLVLYAAGRAIYCDRCGNILDAPKTWIHGAEVLCDKCHHVEPLDLDHPSGLAGIAPEDFA